MFFLSHSLLPFLLSATYLLNCCPIHHVLLISLKSPCFSLLLSLHAQRAQGPRGEGGFPSGCKRSRWCRSFCLPHEVNHWRTSAGKGTLYLQLYDETYRICLKPMCWIKKSLTARTCWYYHVISHRTVSGSGWALSEYLYILRLSHTYTTHKMSGGMCLIYGNIRFSSSTERNYCIHK